MTSVLAFRGWKDYFIEDVLQITCCCSSAQRNYYSVVHLSEDCLFKNDHWSWNELHVSAAKILPTPLSIVFDRLIEIFFSEIAYIIFIIDHLSSRYNALKTIWNILILINCLDGLIELNIIDRWSTKLIGTRQNIEKNCWLMHWKRRNEWI